MSYLGIANSALTMVASLTVVGLGFGQSNATPSDRVDSVACGTAAWNSASSIVCLNSSGPVMSSVEVTVVGLAGTRFPAFTFDGALWITRDHAGSP